MTPLALNLLDGLSNRTLRAYALDCAEHVAVLSDERWMLQTALSEARGLLMVLDASAAFEAVSMADLGHQDTLRAMGREQYRTILGAMSDIQSCLQASDLQVRPRCEEAIYRTCLSALSAAIRSRPRTYATSAMQSAISAVWAHQEYGEPTGLEDMEIAWHMGRIEAHRDGRALPPIHDSESLGALIEGQPMASVEVDDDYDLQTLNRIPPMGWDSIFGLD